MSAWDSVDAWIMENYPDVFMWYLVTAAMLFAGVSIAGAVARLRGDGAATEAIVSGTIAATFCGALAWIVSTTL